MISDINNVEERWYDRTLLMLGQDSFVKIQNTHVVVVGVGGVGGYAAEMLVRSGVGKITIIDSDNVSVTNINRQLIACHETVGSSKVELFKKRFLKINPNLKSWENLSPDYAKMQVDIFNVLPQFCDGVGLKIIKNNYE